MQEEFGKTGPRWISTSTNLPISCHLYQDEHALLGVVYQLPLLETYVGDRRYVHSRPLQHLRELCLSSRQVFL